MRFKVVEKQKEADSPFRVRHGSDSHEERVEQLILFFNDGSVSLKKYFETYANFLDLAEIVPPFVRSNMNHEVLQVQFG